MNESASLPFGTGWAIRHRKDSELMDCFQRHARPISDVRFRNRQRTSSVSTEIQIGGLSLIAVRSDPVCFTSLPDSHLSIVVPTSGRGTLSDGVATVHWSGNSQVLRTSHGRSVEFGYDDVCFVAIRPDFEALSREAARLHPSCRNVLDRLTESGSEAFAAIHHGVDYSALILGFFKMIDACSGDAELLRRIRLDAAITKLIASLVVQKMDLPATQAAPVRAPDMGPGIDAVCDRIQSSIGTPLTIDEMQDVSGLSALELNEAFKRRFGCTPQEWQRNCHLDRARQLLGARENVPSVERVSHELGFSSVQSLLWHYKKRFGELPLSMTATAARTRRH